MDTDVVIIGGGVCGVLAGRRFAKEGFTYKIIEKAADFGGVWHYRANDYSHLQAYADLYTWDRDYPLHKNPFHKCPGTTVLKKLREYGTEYGLREHTIFNTEVTEVVKNNDRFVLSMKTALDGESSRMRAKSVFVCTGILGRQYAFNDRFLNGAEGFTGLKMFAGRQSEATNYLNHHHAEGKDVVILGSGAFGLEAMEAAHRADAQSITLVTRERNRWIIPYSEQFRFVVLARCRWLPRSIRCFLLSLWLRSRYKDSGMEYMMPDRGTSQNFTGQCNDAFFQYAKQGIARYVVSDVSGLEGTMIHLQNGETLHADILVTALGHEVQRSPSFLRGLGIGFTTDLHNFAFLGKNPYLGCASDWVWFNVPHGPQKQIESFVAALRACEAGEEEAIRENLLPTPFIGCKGEPLNCRFPSELQERDRAEWRSLSAGQSFVSKIWLWVKLRLHEEFIWQYCCWRAVGEYWYLRDWNVARKRKVD